MREIKFRAWDKKYNRMFHIVGPGYFDAEYQDFNFKVDFDDEDLRWNLDSEYWEIMQYTGLKDKNGKEIYEGDVVAYNESVMSDTGEDKQNYIEKRIDKGFIYSDGKRGERRYGREIKVVEWQESSCGFEPFSDSHDNCGHCGGGDTPMGCEVIGNIYENPELL